MVVVADINTIWRSRPFVALSELQPVLGLKPHDRLMAMKQQQLPFGTRRGMEESLQTLSIVLPLGWATRNSEKTMRRLWAEADKECRRADARATAVVVTSPHYAPLVESVSPTIPTYYYCSDDYQSYRGWDAVQMRELEARILGRARHSFFVSAALRDRAVRDYAAEPARLSVSMNATESLSLHAVPPEKIAALFRRHPRLKRPVVGVVGGVNDRLDFELLGAVADLLEIGTLLIVGDVTTPLDPKCVALLNHSRVVAIGQQPHNALPAWQQLLDVALIPYRKTPFNYFCSPMRLFDHLAAGKPMVATDACAQVREFEDCITIASSTADFLAAVKSGCSPGISCELAHRMKVVAAGQLWSARARVMDATLRR
jgi:teichuronic acid biosynthesis glycosyltransferase TuaH